MQWILIGLVLLLQVGEVAADSWRPQLVFSVEDSGYEKTLIFVSGLSYALTYSAQHLAEAGGTNFYCLPPGRIPDSKLIVDLLNSQLSGPQCAEVVTSTAFVALREEFPCR
jgi:hypothetical protein